MNDAKYLFLMQRHFDTCLTEIEESELRGYLAGNRSAAALFASLTKIIKEIEKLDLPESLRNLDEDSLHKTIIDNITVQRPSSFLINLLHRFMRRPGSRSLAADSQMEALQRKSRRRGPKPPLQVDSLRGTLAPFPIPTTTDTPATLANMIKQKLSERKMPEPVQERKDQDQLGPDAVRSQLQWQAPQLSEHAEPVDSPADGLNLGRFVRTSERSFANEDSSAHDPGEWSPPVGLSNEQNFEWNCTWVSSYPGQPVNDFNDSIPRSENAELDALFEPVIEPERARSPEASSSEQVLSDSEAAVQSCDPVLPVKDIISHIDELFAESIENTQQTASATSAPPSASRRLAAVNSSDSSPETSNGRITSFGKFLFDKNSEEIVRSIASTEKPIGNAKILTEEESDNLRVCLKTIEQEPKVVGCIVLGYDGIPVTSTLPSSIDADTFSAWALLAFINSQDVIFSLGHKKLTQMVSKTGMGYLILCDFGLGLLLVVSEDPSTTALLPLMDSVRQVTAA